MRSSTPPDFAGRCPRCFVREDLCLCAQIPRIETRTRLLVLRHTSEAWKTANTARLAALALPTLELVSYGRREDVVNPGWFSGEGTALLFPDGPRWPTEAPPPTTVIVLDGTWPQARRMVQRLAPLRKVPRLVLPPPANPARRLRIPPNPEGMSTIEAIAETLALLEGEAVAAPLRALHERLIEAVVTTRGDFLTPRFEARARAGRRTS